uniref:BPI protein 3 n=1 Tax=Perinereis linea TaxID=2507842 RepID=A0A481MSN0_9ANNE|nr:BPI protein 3 [Perinereis linea]
MWRPVAVTFFLTELIVITASFNDGITIQVPASLLQSNGEKVTKNLESYLPGTEFPDMDGEADLSVGYLFYHLSGMRMLTFGIPHTSIDIIPGVGIRASINSLHLSICGNWSYETLLGLGGDGHFVVNISGVDITFTFTLESDGEGQPNASMVSCSSSVQEVIVETHQWFTNMFSDQIADNIIYQMSTEICNGTTHGLADVRGMIQQYLSIEVIPDWFVDLSLAEPPVFSYGYMSLKSKAQVFVSPNCDATPPCEQKPKQEARHLDRTNCP